VRGLDPELVAALHRLAVDDCIPRLTIVLDLPVREGRRRLMRRPRPVGDQDRFEAESDAFHDKVRRGYLRLARADRRRMKVVDAVPPPDLVEEAIWEIVKHVL
jgi:dTMP kinase